MNYERDQADEHNPIESFFIGPIGISQYHISCNMELVIHMLECTLAEYFKITTFGLTDNPE